MADYINREVAIAKLTALEVTEPNATMADAKRVLADMPSAKAVSFHDILCASHSYCADCPANIPRDFNKCRVDTMKVFDAADAVAIVDKKHKEDR